MDSKQLPSPSRPAVEAPAPSRSRLRAAVAQLDRLAPAGLRALADELEEVGLVAEATRAMRRLLELEPRDGAAWARLAALHDERADFERSARCRARAQALGAVVAPGPRAPDEEAGGPLGFAPSDIERFVSLFSGREDHHARQWADAAGGRGGYSPIAEPLTAEVARAHLAGRVTVGSYLLRSDARVGFLCLDLDASRAAFEEARGNAERVASLRSALEHAGRTLCGVLGQLGLPHLYEDSGQKGRHLWLFFAAPVPASDALAFGRALVAAHAPTDPRLHLEVFPKQDQPSGKGMGNLVKLPLGIHKVSGRRSVLLRADGTPEPDPARALQRVSRVDGATLAGATSTLAHRAPARSAPPPAGQPSARQGLSVWTEEELSADPQFSTVLAGCAVLRRVVERALAGDALAHPELVGLEHTLGHLDHGAEGVNLLLSRVPGVSVERRLGHKHTGFPTSCAKLRRRLVGIAHRVGCQCDFGPRLPTYPNPLLHLSGGPGDVALAPTED